MAQLDLDHDGQVSADDLYEYIYGQMFTTTAKQIPKKWVFNVDAKLIVAHNPAPPDTLFISYAREDADFASQINNDLQKAGIKTWIDELGIRSGEDWPDRIATAISSAKAVLFILSPHSLASKWVQRESGFC